MNKKEIFIPFLLVGLSVLFAIISFAVFMSNGKSKKWVARKMKIGGLLLTLTSTSIVPSCITCYDMPGPPNTITIYPNSDNGIELMMDTGNVIFGTIYERQGENFSFSILDTNNQIVQSNVLIPSDGKFNNHTEEFRLEIDTNIIAGTYSLHLFDVNVAEQANTIPKQEINLLIKNN